MSSDTATAHAEAHDHPEVSSGVTDPAFADIKYNDIVPYDPMAAKLGMWLFLFTEVLLFGALFIAYGVYLEQFGWQFQLGSSQLSVPVGGFNTLVLLTSSMTMALAIAALQRNKPALSQKMMNATIGFAVVFCIVKAFEWGGKFEHQLYPGTDLMKSLDLGEQAFFSLYFIMTGLHALHVLIGAGLILWVKAAVKKRRVNYQRMALIDNVGLYWHIVDLIWIFLFPLFYLIG